MEVQELIFAVHPCITDHLRTVDLQYDEIDLTFTAGYVSLCCVGGPMINCCFCYMCVC